jgi:PAS domain S-box-containing protein
MSKSLVNYPAQLLSNDRSDCSQPVGFPFRFPRAFGMSHRVSALASLLHSPLQILGIVLLVVFLAEVGVMILLPFVASSAVSSAVKAVLDATILTAICAPALWWVLIGPLRRIAVQEHLRSETIVANAAESILTFDRTGVILSANRAAELLFGLSAEKLVGSDLFQLVDSIPQPLAPDQKQIRAIARSNDGKSFPVQASLGEFPSEVEPIWFIVLRDLTQNEAAERERLERAREAEALKTQQMATLAQLATGVAHEIRNPLTSIKMLIQVNRKVFAEKGFPADDLKLVEDEIRRMERSVTSLLEFARPEQAEFHDFQIQESILRAAQLVEAKCRAGDIALQLPAHYPDSPVFGDSAKISQLLLNLMLNAIDAMQDGGELQVRVETDDDALILQVVDDGDGISPEVQEKLFSPFVTTKANGVGLGLGICRQIAQAHGGSIRGYNAETRGAVFELRLPLSSSQSSQGLAERSTTTAGPRVNSANEPANKDS